MFVLAVFNAGAIKGWPDTVLFGTPCSAENSNLEDGTGIGIGEGEIEGEERGIEGGDNTEGGVPERHHDDLFNFTISRN